MRDWPCARPGCHNQADPGELFCCTSCRELYVAWAKQWGWFKLEPVGRCFSCGTGLDRKHTGRGALYCGNACRQAAFRARNRLLDIAALVARSCSEAVRSVDLTLIDRLREIADDLDDGQRPHVDAAIAALEVLARYSAQTDVDLDGEVWEDVVGRPMKSSEETKATSDIMDARARGDRWADPDPIATARREARRRARGWMPEGGR